MLLASTQQHQACVDTPPSSLNHRSGSHEGVRRGPGTNSAALLSPPGGSMERGAPEYSQSGLPSPYPSNFGDTQSEASVDHASAATYTTQQEVRSNYSTTATPTSDYSVYPSSARSSTFPEHIQRSYHPASNPTGSSGGMAQTPTSPSSLQDGRTHQSPQQARSDSDVPIDPSIAAPSPTYVHGGQYSPYAPPPPTTDMAQHYAPHPSYPQPRPDWSGYSQTPVTPGHHVFPQTPTSAPPQARPNQFARQVYSFVPIPGAQQHKRPRRRYEEIERMYKCGWNGCEKAYGTLNHLNAHVTMQAHGQKRTPEEFKEIRKEWKARKKEEEAARKAEEERQRAAASAQSAADPQSATDGTQPPTTYPGSRPVQLPPIGYQPTQYPAPPSGGIQGSLPTDYSNTGHVYASYNSPNSPYGAPNQQMYNQHNGGQPNH